MVEIDPTVLAATVAIAAVAIAAVSSCGSGKPSASQKKPSKKKQEPKQAPVEKPPAKKASSKAPAENKVATKPATKPAPTPSPQEVIAPAPETVAATNEKKGKKSKETPEQRAARLERQKNAKQKKIEAATSATVESDVDTLTSAAVGAPTPSVTSVSDGWEIVTDKRKQKPKKAKQEVVKSQVGTETSASEGALTAIDETTGTLQVEAKKVGILIGPKGATMHAIQDATDTKITMPKTDRDSSAAASVSVAGPAEGVAKALSIMRELCSKGYALALEGEGFQESSISVNSK